MAPVIILAAPQMGENIGAAARVMANFDLTDLRLVAPRDGWPNEKAEAMASGAEDIVHRAEVFDDVASAVADLRRVYATTARPREMIKPVATPREAGAAMAAEGGPTGILFGPERTGLANEDVVQADTILAIPVGAHASLNLAQAVGIVAYEIFMAAGPALPLIGENVPAKKAEIMALFEHLEAALDERGFFYPAEKRPTMVRNLRNLLQRRGLLEQDVRLLHGVFKALTRPPREK